MDMFQHKVSALEGVVCDLSTNPEVQSSSPSVIELLSVSDVSLSAVS